MTRYQECDVTPGKGKCFSRHYSILNCPDAEWVCLLPFRLPFSLRSVWVPFAWQLTAAAMQLMTMEFLLLFQAPEQGGACHRAPSVAGVALEPHGGILQSQHTDTVAVTIAIAITAIVTVPSAYITRQQVHTSACAGS